MKRKIIFLILLAAGIVPFIIPLAMGFYEMSIASWTMLDWLIMYSFIYWPTYLVGLLLITASILIIKFKKS